VATPPLGLHSPSPNPSAISLLTTEYFDPNIQHSPTMQSLKEDLQLLNFAQQIEREISTPPPADEPNTVSARNTHKNTVSDTLSLVVRPEEIHSCVLNYAEELRDAEISMATIAKHMSKYDLLKVNGKHIYSLLFVLNNFRPISI
jgi:hypothetical protein